MDALTESRYFEAMLAEIRKENTRYKVYDYKRLGDWFETEETYATLQEANDEALYQWNHLTYAEQKRSHVFVGTADDDIDIPEGAFDSEEFVAKLVWGHENEVE